MCIATYNGEKYIKQQLLSVLPQLSDEDEIIISDDGSSDGTLVEADSLHSPLIRVVHNQGEHGFAPNFENALGYAKGDYIFLCDQDDVWMPRKVEICLKALESCDFVFTDATVTDADMNVTIPSFWQYVNSGKNLISCIVRFSHLGCCMAFRRCVLRHALPFPRCHRLATHDNWLGLVGLSFYRTQFIAEPLFFYRRHGENASNATNASITSTWYKLEYRLYLLWYLAKRAITVGRKAEKQ